LFKVCLGKTWGKMGIPTSACDRDHPDLSFVN